MLPTLNANEARVIGSLMEKQVTTPEQYPLTLNALTNACNQKSSRNPVMSLDPGAVQRAVRDLQAKLYVRTEENFKRGVEKYKQRLCNTSHSDFQFDSAQYAIVCLLLLRGPQTPGELRAHSGRLHTFEDNSAVVQALQTLIDRGGEPLVVRLPRVPGRKDSEYMHLLCGPIDLEAYASRSRQAAPGIAPERASSTALIERVETLEAQVAELTAQVSRLLREKSSTGFDHAAT